MDTTQKVTRDLAISAYLLLLGREPENEEVIRDALQCGTVEQLRRSFLESEEFSQQLLQKAARLRFPLDGEQELQIDIKCDESKLAKLFTRVESTWQKLGKEDPYWSVVTWDGFRSENFESNQKHFWGGGNQDVQRLLVWLQRNQVSPQSDWTCLEYGCGTGRVTPWLAKRFKNVVACDISNPHLSIAREKWGGHRNIRFERIENLEAVSQLPSFDLLFSIIVLQHNPPPVIAYILESLLRSMRPGGIAYFQVPTFCRGYRFNIDDYLDSAESGMEMHVLPQRAVFEIARKNNCNLLEVQPDNLTGSFEMISNTFLFQKQSR